MSKAIEGAVLLAGAVAMGALAFADPALIASPLYDKAMFGLALGGISMEAGAIASALTANRGMNITTRQPASYRQVIYGTQRVGGVIVYRSTTGSHHDQYNYVIVLAGHEIDSIQALYLDGRQVFFANGVGTTTRNGVTFGGSANGNTYTGPNGVQYNFGGKVYCEACYGDQTNQPNTVPGGGYNTGLHANDPVWAPSAAGTPYLGGCAYIYLKVEYDSTLFPGEPEIRFTINGKNTIYDPRTNTTGFSSNWALIVADVITDPLFGVGDSTVNQAQLIAAANVCDEQVALAAGGTESRYSCHWHYDTSLAPGDVLSSLMGAAAGRLSRIGGEWYIFPAYFQGPTASFDADALTGPVQWMPTKSYRELFNRVTGTYIAPSYPYNVAGNYYDGNGFNNGEIQNNFPFAFQPTNYPQYACDPEHGYASDEYLNEDGGTALPMEISQQCVLSVAQAQRLAKINLLRNRQQGGGTFQMALSAYQLQPCDTFTMTFAQNGWAGKLLEVNSVHFQIETGSNGTPPQILLHVGVNETEASVYEWTAPEELTVYDVPAASQTQSTPYPPTNMTLTSSAATAVRGADGIVDPRVMVQWDTPLDGFVTQIQVQYQATTSGAPWIDAGLVDVCNNAAYVGNVIAGQEYNFRIRSIRASGAGSVWVETDSYTVTLTLSSVSSAGLNPNSPYNTSNNATVDSIAETSAATIRVYGPGGDGSAFTRFVGAVSSSMNAAHITGQQFTTAYFVIYDTVGLTYLALTNYNDTLADSYIFIGSVVTCADTYTGTGTGTGSGSSGGGGAAPGGGRNPITQQQQDA